MPEDIDYDSYMPEDMDYDSYMPEGMDYNSTDPEIMYTMSEDYKYEYAPEIAQSNMTGPDGKEKDFSIEDAIGMLEDEYSYNSILEESGIFEGVDIDFEGILEGLPQIDFDFDDMDMK
jgi:hypothetical protein